MMETSDAILKNETTNRRCKIYPCEIRFQSSLFTIHGKTENNWPLSNGKFLVPMGTTNAHEIAFNATEDSEDFV